MADGVEENESSPDARRQKEMKAKVAAAIVGADTGL
jgi:hypothetical protein